MDAFNFLLLFTSLFYYSAQTNSHLYSITSFLVRIGQKIFNLILLIFYLVLAFAIAVFYFFEQTIEEMNDFSSALISAFSLSLGNGVLNEREILINDMGEHIYNFVSPSVPPDPKILISEFIIVQIISVTLIYVVTSREFLRQS